jgi:SAM-dependent methyltransferase
LVFEVSGNPGGAVQPDRVPYPGAMTDPSRPHARSFGAAAERYDRHRPTYAVEAVVWALGERPLRVADLGAGTGILSRLLRTLGHEVIAVEPDAQMRARLAEVSPGVAVLGGTAEEIPLADRSVDALVAGQAYHWFDPVRARPEIARVLRPGGVVAALRNDADDRTQWTVQLVEIIDGAEAAAGGPWDPDFGERFGPVDGADFRHEMWLTPDDLVSLATTRSPYLVATPAAQRDLLDAVRRLIAGPELAGLERFAMPQLTRVRRATVNPD